MQTAHSPRAGNVKEIEFVFVLVPVFEMFDVSSQQSVVSEHSLGIEASGRKTELA